MSSLDQILDDTVENKNFAQDHIKAQLDPQEPKKENIVTRLIKRKRGRPKGTGKKPAAAIKSTVPPEILEKYSKTFENKNQAGQYVGQEPVSDINAVKRRTDAAKGATMLIQTSGMIVAGEEGKMQPDEFAHIEENFNRYFELKGIADFPPGIALGLSLGMYYMRTLTAEKSRPKVGLVMAWVKSRLSFFKKKKKQVAETQGQDHGAHADHRNDTIG